MQKTLHNTELQIYIIGAREENKMRNSKNLKTTLSAISIIAIFVAMIMSIIVSVTYNTTIMTEGGQWTMSYFYEMYGGAGLSTAKGVCINWNFAGLYFAMLVVALGTLITKFAMFTVPTIKSRSNNACIALLCEILVLVGLVFAIVALFLPQARMTDIYEEVEGGQQMTQWYKDLFTTNTIAGWVACPLAFIASLGTIGVNRLGAKK